MSLPYLKFSDPLPQTHLFFIWPYIFSMLTHNIYMLKNIRNIFIFLPYQFQCFYPLLCTGSMKGSMQEDRNLPRYDRKIVDWDIRHENKNLYLCLACQTTKQYWFNRIPGLSCFNFSDSCLSNLGLQTIIVCKLFV